MSAISLNEINLASDEWRLLTMKYRINDEAMSAISLNEVKN